jgi:hypothetical protein
MTFSTTDLVGMRATQVEHMMDTCKLQANVQTKDTHGQLVDTWPVDGDELVCGLDMSPGSERHGADMSILVWDATVRLPITSAPGARDRVKVTKRHGEALGAALVYDIVGPVQRGPSGVRLRLKRVET